jgi:tetratricopeptide (TPR) repeat protein
MLNHLDGVIKNANPEEQPEGGAAGNAGRDTAETTAARGRAMLIALRDDPAMVRLLLEAARDNMGNRDDLQTQTRVLLAVLAERTRQLEIAEELYRSCLTRPIRPEGGQQTVYSGLLSVLMREHKYDAVVALCKHGLIKAGNVNRMLLFLDLSEAQTALGTFDDALTSANQAVEVANPEARLLCQHNRVDVLSKMGRHAEAIAACQEMLREYNQPQKEEEPLALERQKAKVREVRLLLSFVYSAAQQPEKSEEQLRLLLDAKADDETANNNLGFQWAERGINLPEAERMIRKAIELDRTQRSAKTAVGMDSDVDNAAYIDSLGWVLFRKGDLKGARAELEKAAKLPGGDDDPVVWDHLADVLFRLGEKDKAIAAWQKALALFDARVRPKDERYKEIQQKLKQTAP